MHFAISKFSDTYEIGFCLEETYLKPDICSEGKFVLENDTYIYALNFVTMEKSFDCFFSLPLY